MAEVGDEYKATIDVVEEDDGMFTCYIVELNHELTLTETKLEGLEKVG